MAASMATDVAADLRDIALEVNDCADQAERANGEPFTTDGIRVLCDCAAADLTDISDALHE